MLHGRLQGGWKCCRAAGSVARATAGRLEVLQGGWKCCRAAESVARATAGRMEVLQGG